MADLDICPLEELPPGTVKIVRDGELDIGVYNLDGELYGLYLGVLVALPLYHAAHRLRFVIHHQLGLHGGRRLVAAACYGAALAGTALTVVALVRI